MHWLDWLPFYRQFPRCMTLTLLIVESMAFWGIIDLLAQHGR